MGYKFTRDGKEYSEEELEKTLKELFYNNSKEREYSIEFHSKEALDAFNKAMKKEFKKHLKGKR